MWRNLCWVSLCNFHIFCCSTAGMTGFCLYVVECISSSCSKFFCLSCHFSIGYIFFFFVGPIYLFLSVSIIFVFFFFGRLWLLLALQSKLHHLSSQRHWKSPHSSFSSQLSCDFPQAAQSSSVNVISVVLRVWGACFSVASTLRGFLSSSILSVIVNLSLSSHTSKTEAVGLRSSTTLPLLCTLGDGLSRNPFKYGP